MEYKKTLRLLPVIYNKGRNKVMPCCTYYCRIKNYQPFSGHQCFI